MTSASRTVEVDPPATGAQDHATPSWRPVAVFLAIAFGLPWLLRLVAGADIVAAGGMVAVGVATFVTVRRFRPRAGIALDTGLRGPFPLRTILKHSALAFAAMLGLAVLAVVIGAITGVYSIDLDHFSGLRMVLRAGPEEPVGTLVLRLLAQSLALFLVLLPLAFCEEWGWRGFLLSRLRPLGTWPAMLLSGLIWGLWHLPAYVGPDRRQPSGLVPFLIFCVLLGILLGWLRLATGSIWAATVAHAAHNTVVIAFVNVVLSDADQLTSADPWSFGLGGWPGWIAMSLAIVLLVTTSRGPLGRKSRTRRAAGREHRQTG